MAIKSQYSVKTPKISIFPTPTPFAPKYQTQENSEGEVIVSVTPVRLSEKENVKFKVSLNTHSVELNYDLKNLAVLTDDNDIEYRPISWDGGVGGHHLEGNLIFPPLSKKVEEVTLKISGISGADRVFKWNF